MARLRKTKYTPPVGDAIDDLPTSEDECLWLWLSCFCKSLKTWIPLAYEPETMGWDDARESLDKESAEKIQLEKRNVDEVKSALKILVAEWQWPDCSEEISFLATERLDWASRFASVMSVLKNSNELTTLDLPDCPPRGWFFWVAFELYDLDVSLP